MATSTKTKKVSTEVVEDLDKEEVKEIEEISATDIYSILKKMQEQIDFLAKENKKIKDEKIKLEKEIVAQTEVISLPEEELKDSTNITVISLFPGTLNLCTEDFGRGKVRTFEKYGEKKKIPYGVLKEMFEHSVGFARKGYYYICDDRVVQEFDLVEEYKTLLTPKLADKILEATGELSVTLIDALENCEVTQLKNIEGKILENLINNEKLDINNSRRIIYSDYLFAQLNGIFSRRFGIKDYSLRKKVDESLEYQNIYKESSSK